jgi:hypothetical protein
MTSSRPTPSNASPSNAAPANSPSLAQGALQQIERFTNALGELLNDITALEVNTMVVSQITGAKFLPEDAYLDMFELYHQHADEEKYASLRRSFESSCKDCMKKMGMGLDHPLPDPGNPAEAEMVDHLLTDGEFLRNLRKLNELKALMGGVRADQNNITDIIYAQTVIQLDGDVINRFHEQLFSHRLSPEDKQFLIQVHSEAVTSGEENWRGLLKFLFDLVQGIITRRSRGAGGSASPNGKN